MKETFVFRTKWIELFDESDLTAEEVVVMLSAISNYAASGEKTEFNDRTLKAVYSAIVKELDKDMEKYEETCKRNRENGKKGGRPKKPSGLNENPENPSGFLKTHSNPKNPKNPDNDNDNDNDNDLLIINYIDVELYFKKMGYRSDPMQFHKYYEAKNWYRGKIDWRDLAKNWEEQKTKPPNKALNYQQRTDSYAELERMLANS